MSFFDRASERGGARALLAVGDHLRRAGEIDEATRFYQRSADAAGIAAAPGQRGPTGDHFADMQPQPREPVDDGSGAADLGSAAAALLTIEKFDEAAAVAARLADLGDVERLEPVVQALVKAGRESAAITLLVGTVEEGRTDVRPALVRLLLSTDRIDEAFDCYRQAVSEGERAAACWMAAQLAAQGLTDMAVDIYLRSPIGETPDAVDQIARQLPYFEAHSAVFLERIAAETGSIRALRHAAERWARRRDGRTRAVRLFRRAAEAGDPGAMEQATELAVDVYGTEAAVRWLLRLARRRPDAFSHAADQVAEIGHVDRAIYLYRRGEAAGDPAACAKAAALSPRKRLLDEQIAASRAAAEYGALPAQWTAFQLMLDAGRYGDARAWLLERGAAGSDSRKAAQMLETHGFADEALTLHRQAAENGDAHALRQAVRLLKDAGRIGDGLTWLCTLAHAGHTSALYPAAGLARQLDRMDESVDLYRRSAAAGYPKALWTAAGLLLELGRDAEAIPLYRELADSGSKRAQRQLAELVEKHDVD
ncbi:hypothetical protein OG788_40100 [Streptomyces sp. NBC_00647]|uniref:hypothetical protein n=1 Tax=Streptomyces sp. NBC_00647 TaxID=2975796 RepID=UPI00324968E3